MRAARELLKDLEYEVVSGSVDVNVNELIYNTKMVSKECMFVCIRGAVFAFLSVRCTAARQQEQAQQRRKKE